MRDVRSARDRKTGPFPLGKSVFEPSSQEASCVKLTHGFVGIDAIRTSAVGHDLGISRKRLDVSLQLGDGHRLRPCNVAGLVFGLGPDVEHHEVATPQPECQLVSTNHLDALTVPEICSHEAFDSSDVLRPHVTQRRPQFGHPITRKRVVDARAIASGRDQARSREYSQVMRRVGHALLDLAGNRFNGSFALRKHVDDLGPPPARHCFRDSGETLEESIFRSTVAHCCRWCLLTLRLSIFKRLLDNASQLPEYSNTRLNMMEAAP